MNKWWRYANFAIHPTQTNLLVTLREDHTYDPDGTHSDRVVNTICVVDTSRPDDNPTTIIQGAGFYATPVLNPSGNKIGWQAWNLPYMPWEAGLVYVADVAVDSGSLKLTSEKVLVNGDPKHGTSSATFPKWITDTTLTYITDAYNQFQNPYIYNTETKDSTAILKKDQDFAELAWYLGYYPYAILGGGKYGAFTAFQDGRNILYIIDFTASSAPVQIAPFDYTVAQHVRTVTEDTFVFTASQAAAPGGVIEGTVSPDKSSVTFKVLKASADPSPLTNYISTPEPERLPASGGCSTYVVYYPPYNPDYSGTSITEKPPYILNVHGGPTGLEPQALNWTKMFYTSPGFGW
ncbi:hypothetical protein OG21DRAFT_818509 [Imleria badia]|nr:hypothetical protein OG21DRAFT_818509 [Imleria badia]